MITCGTCGTESPDGFRFCPQCASPLSGPERAVEERRVVTTLFCDLVGFTALSDEADPEDIDRMLRGYLAVGRNQIEKHGGAVEKFIGDAVVGVFGVPAAHEDDPERAVRAGLRIVEDAAALRAASGEPLRLRVGINTGEVLARLDVSPGSGEGFLTGDAVNTASRLQGIAPPMGVVVGEATFFATERVIDYDELDRVTVKGKIEPLRVFLARSPRSRIGTDVTRTHTSPFVGREADLSALEGVFDEVVVSRSARLAVITGEPGIGKTRIVGELTRYVDARPELVTWRQGRCLPYGEGVTFWALGEIVKAHAGILETDDSAVAGRKLDAVLPDTPERGWLRQRLGPLVGLGSSSAAERDETFAAWRTFLESIARDPTVLVFEDLHWADDAMLEFLQHLARHVESVPLLLLGTTRPELFVSHPGWAQGLPNVTRLPLRPLNDKETARLVAALLEQAVLPAEVQHAILERAGGNPLYAMEFVRLLKDRHLLRRTGQAFVLAEGVEIPQPESVQALIAARLDMLAPERKAVLADASIVGKVFWIGVLAEMGGRDPSEVEEAMRDLERRELVHPASQSSMAGKQEYAISHALVREVAYGQIPRAARSQKHRAAARWIERTAGDRVEDVAEVLAGHYATALDLARAVGQIDEARELEEPALRYLVMAAERVLDLDALKAEAMFARALELAPKGHADVPAIMVRWAEAAALRLGRYAEGEPLLTEAIGVLAARGDDVAAARALLTLSKVRGNMGDPRGPDAAIEAVRLLEGHPAGPDLMAAYTEMAVTATVDEGKHRDAIAWAERALSLAAELGLPEPARAMGFRGMARCQSADPGGLSDILRAIELATDRGESRDAAALANNLAIALWPLEGPQRSLDTFTRGIAAARARGITELALAMACSRLDALVDVGKFAQVLDEAGELEAQLEGSGDAVSLVEIRSARARVLVLRGEIEAALHDAERSIEVARAAGVPELIGLSYPPAAAARAAAGNLEGAHSLLIELLGVPNIRDNGYYAMHLTSVVRTAIACGDPELAQRFTLDLDPTSPLAEHASAAASAVLDQARGDLERAETSYRDVVERWTSFGVVPELALAQLGLGRCSVSIGRPGDAVGPLQACRALFLELGMAPALADADDLLARATALSS